MIEILHLELSYLWFNIFSATWWRINRTWTRKNSWSERAKCLFGPEVAIVLPLYKVAIVLTKYSHLTKLTQLQGSDLPLIAEHCQNWLINYDSIIIRRGNSKWQAVMNQELMKVSLVISGPSGPDQLTNCLTWIDIDWLRLRYQVMFWPWTGCVTSFDLLNTVVLWLW